MHKFWAWNGMSDSVGTVLCTSGVFSDATNGTDLCLELRYNGGTRSLTPIIVACNWGFNELYHSALNPESPKPTVWYTSSPTYELQLPNAWTTGAFVQTMCRTRGLTELQMDNYYGVGDGWCGGEEFTAIVCWVVTNTPFEKSLLQSVALSRGWGLCFTHLADLRSWP